MRPSSGRKMVVAKKSTGEKLQIIRAVLRLKAFISALTTTPASVPPILAIIRMNAVPIAMAPEERPLIFQGTLMAMGTKAKAPKPARKKKMQRMGRLAVFMAKK